LTNRLTLRLAEISRDLFQSASEALDDFADNEFLYQPRIGFDEILFAIFSVRSREGTKLGDQFYAALFDTCFNLILVLRI
jgi:hypothetical protein